MTSGGGVEGFMAQAQRLQSMMTEVQTRLKETVVEGAAGGGLVKVRMNGHHEVVRLVIDSSTVDPEDLELLEDLIVAAVADARVKADELARDEMARAAREAGIPPAIAQQMMGGNL